MTGRTPTKKFKKLHCQYIHGEEHKERVSFNCIVGNYFYTLVPQCRICIGFPHPRICGSISLRKGTIPTHKLKNHALLGHLMNIVSMLKNLRKTLLRSDCFVLLRFSLIVVSDKPCSTNLFPTNLVVLIYTTSTCLNDKKNKMEGVCQCGCFIYKFCWPQFTLLCIARCRIHMHGILRPYIDRSSLE